MNRIKLITKCYRNTLVAVFAATLLSACGGGGGSSSSPAVNTPTSSAPTGNTITGAVTKGPVSGATVRFYNVSATGFRTGEAIATATTSADGNFEVTLPTDSGAVLVESSGGVYIDESDDEPDVALKRRISLTDTQILTSYLPTGSTTVAITPFTMSMVERARIMSSLDGSFVDRFAEARAAVTAQFGFDVFTTVPANPVAPASDATEAQIQYALLLGGLANVINNVSLKAGLAAPTYEVLIAVTNDLIDGAIDGRSFGASIVIANSPGDDTPGELASLATDVNFTNEINRFKNNNASNYVSATIPVVVGSSLVNTAPTANAGADQTAATNTALEISGAASTDAESGLSYSWVQTAGSTVNLENSNLQAISFTTPSLLVGTDTLSFELTVTDALGLTSTDSVSVTVNGTLPLTFAVLDLNEFGRGIGEDIDGGGKFLLNADGSGGLLIDDGLVAVNWTSTETVLHVTFPNGFVIDDHEEFVDVNNDNVQEKFIVKENASFFDITVVSSQSVVEAALVEPSDLKRTSNSVLVTIREEGIRTFTADGHEFTKPDEEYSFENPLEVFDYSQQIPFTIAAGSKRILQINALPQFPLLFSEKEPTFEVFTFNDGGTGTTRHNNINFDWSVEADGHLKVAFANGESADYYHHGVRDTGDVISTEYHYLEPLGDNAGKDAFALALSFELDAPTPTELSQVAGIYTGLLFRDDLDRSTPLSVRLHPDGTGSVEFEFNLNGRDQFVTSSNGVCWTLEGDQIRMRRATTIGLTEQSSRESSVDFCASLNDSNVRFEYNLQTFRISGDQYKSFAVYSENGCGTNLSSCDTPAQVIKNFDVRITTKVAFTAVPPLAVYDFTAQQGLTPITLDLLANDLARGGNAIDKSTFEIVLEPANGSYTVDPSTKVVTYTPSTGGRDVIQYRIKDSEGNLSNIGRWDIITGNPVAVVVDLPGVQQGALVSLDGSSSTDDVSIVSYNWEQTGGTSVGLSNPSEPVTTFNAPELATLFEAETLSFRLTVTDNLGQQGVRDISVTVEAKTSKFLFAIEKYELPIQFGRDVSDGNLIELYDDGNGNLVSNKGSFSFAWTSTGSSIDIAFTGDGMLIQAFTSFVVVTEGEPAVEVNSLLYIQNIAFVITENGAVKDKFVRTAQLIEKRVVVASGVALADQSSQLQANFLVFNGFKLEELPTNSVRSLVTNITTNIPTLPAQQTFLDELTFNSDGTGSTRHKGVTFSWQRNPLNELIVDFSDGERAIYYRLEDRVSGSVVATLYTFANGEVRFYTGLSFVDDAAQVFTTENAPGIYLTKGSEFTQVGPIATTGFYHIRPDGTGTAEFEQIDSVTGELTAVFNSSYGICWNVNAGELVINRTRALNQLFTNSRIPSSSHCSALTNSQVSFKRDLKLFSTTSGGELQTVGKYSVNNCGLQAGETADQSNCDANVLDVDAFVLRIHERIAYDGVPPIAVDDAGTAIDGVVTEFDVLSNDIIDASGAPLDPSKVEIVAGPANGTATIDAVTGIISYNPNAGFENDLIYYRVKDTSGNLSTLGVLAILNSAML